MMVVGAYPSSQTRITLESKFWRDACGLEKDTEA